jgi:hypothetical protein
MREAVLLFGAGLAMRTALALISTRAASVLRYGLKPYDHGTLILAGLALALLAAAAIYLSALRARCIQSTEALREEQPASALRRVLLI